MDERERGRKRARQPAEGGGSQPRRRTFAPASAAQTAGDLVREGFAAKERRQYPYLLYSRGVSYEALSLRDRALGDLDVAMALLPQFPNSYIDRALIWADRREFELARERPVAIASAHP